MSVTINTVLCEEHVHNFGESFDLKTGPAPRKGFICDWADRYKVVIGLLGLQTAAGIGGAITLFTPARYPEIANAYCHSVDIQPVGSPTGGGAQIQWPKCIVWANYACIPWFNSSFNQIDPATPIRFAEQRLTSSCEWVTVPGRACKFSNNDLLVGQDYGFRIGLMDIEISLLRLPYIPMQTATSATGKINSVKYLQGGIGQMLFNGATTVRGADVDGTVTQQCTYSFTWRSQRWDYAFNPKTGTWLQVQDVINSQPLIASTDFGDPKTPIIPTDYLGYAT
jgi:hypothetical protein